MSITLMQDEQHGTGPEAVETVSTSEAARILGMTEARIKQLCIEGRLAATKPQGDRWRIELESVRRYDATKREIERLRESLRQKEDAD